MGISIEVADITTLQVDAVVNAASQAMLGGGGVDGAIHRAAGPELLEACKRIPTVAPRIRCPVGEARITPGFRLPASYVIHTVGPIWEGGNAMEEQLLASCYAATLELAVAHNIQSIAFPMVSCGVFRFPPDKASWIAVDTIVDHLAGPSSVTSVVLVAFHKSDAAILENAMKQRSEK